MLLSLSPFPQDGVIAQIGFLGKIWLALVVYTLTKMLGDQCIMMSFGQYIQKHYPTKKCIEILLYP